MSAAKPTVKAEARSQAQRERILAAAQACFVERGFHAASMANIAETAEMSAGLIYRYFENKSAIILAIIERQLNVARSKIAQLRNSTDLVAAIIESHAADQRRDPEAMNSALFLEMSAEATRDPQIGAALSAFDATIRTDLADWLARSEAQGGHGLPPGIATARALMLVCLIEGLKVREAREPLLDSSLVAEGLQALLPAICSIPATT